MKTDDDGATEVGAAGIARLRVTSRCTGCGACVSVCLQRALSLQSEFPDGRGRKSAAVADRCTGCGACLPACLHHALTIDTVTDP